MHSTHKFHHVRGGAATEHRGDLHWPGTVHGIPFRGRVPDLTGDEFDRIVLVPDFHVRVFCLWKSEDVEKFEEIMERAQTPWYVIKKRVEKVVDAKDAPGGAGLWVHLEWVQYYGELPRGQGSHGQIVPIDRTKRSRLV